MILTRYLLSTVSPGRGFGENVSRAAIALMFGIALVPGLDLLSVDSNHSGSVRAALQVGVDSGSTVVVSLAGVALPAGNYTPFVSINEADPDIGRSETNSIPKIAAYVPKQETPPIGKITAPITIAPGSALPQASEKDIAIERADEGVVGAPVASRGCDEIVPDLANGFQSVLKRLATRSIARVREYAALAETTIIGSASTYNPYIEGNGSEEFRTASGDLYDPADWTAAIQIDLRRYFGGVRYGRNYRATYVLIESGGKQAIVRINDVGPLRPGRIIDLNQQSMRYFDPSMQLGLVQDVKVTLLPGDDWRPGPVGEPLPVNLASAD